MQTMRIEKLVLDWNLYPRHDTDKTQVRRMVAALAAGEIFPPILCDKRSLRIVDGFHRYHAYKRAGVEEVLVITKAYRDEAEILLEAVTMNARHGVPLQPYDQARSIMLGQDLGIAPERMAQALAVTPEQLGEITAERFATGPDGLPVILKRSLPNFSGKRISKKQMEINDRLVGMRQEYYLGRVVEMIRHRMIDLANPRVVELLGELRGILNEMGKLDEKAA